MNCSFRDWSMFMVNTNKTTMYLEQHDDIASSLSINTVSLSVIMYIVSVAIVTPNLLLVWGIWRTNKKLNITKILFVYHSLTNNIMGLVSLPYLSLAMRLGLDCRHMAVGNSTGVFSIVVGNMTICQISFLRYLAITRPFKEIQRSLVIGATVLQFAVALCISAINYSANAISVMLYPAQCVVSGTLICVCIFAAILWNSMSLIFIRKQKMVAADSRNNVSARRNFKASRRLTCISVTIGILFLPTAVSYIYIGVLLIRQQIEAQLFVYLFDVGDLVFTPALLCPGISAVVYIAWDDNIKKYYRRVLCCKSPAAVRGKSIHSINGDSIRLRKLKNLIR